MIWHDGTTPERAINVGRPCRSHDHHRRVMTAHPGVWIVWLTHTPRHQSIGALRRDTKLPDTEVVIVPDPGDSYYGTVAVRVKPFRWAVAS